VTGSTCTIKTASRRGSSNKDSALSVNSRSYDDDVGLKKSNMVMMGLDLWRGGTEEAGKLIEKCLLV